MPTSEAANRAPASAGRRPDRAVLVANSMRASAAPTWHNGAVLGTFIVSEMANP